MGSWFPGLHDWSNHSKPGGEYSFFTLYWWLPGGYQSISMPVGRLLECKGGCTLGLLGQCYQRFKGLRSHYSCRYHAIENPLHGVNPYMHGENMQILHRKVPAEGFHTLNQECCSAQAFMLFFTVCFCCFCYQESHFSQAKRTDFKTIFQLNSCLPTQQDFLGKRLGIISKSSHSLNYALNTEMNLLYHLEIGR